MEREGTAAIVLAAGRGKRMQADRPKQYLLLNGKPILYYSLQVFENSPIGEIVLVTGEGEEDYCRREIVERYGIHKVKKIVSGGKERCDSVFSGLKALEDSGLGREGIVFIHDGARPFIRPELLERLLKETKKYGACVAGMPVKDTIKIADENGTVVDTPRRELVWQVQTPQVFSYGLIKEAYERMLESGTVSVTDDAMVIEKMTGHTIQLMEGGYENMKITTPEDIAIAEALLMNCFNL